MNAASHLARMLERTGVRSAIVVYQAAAAFAAIVVPAHQTSSSSADFAAGSPQVDQFDLDVIAGLGLLQHPLRWSIREARRPGGADDDGDPGLSFHGHSCVGSCWTRD